jgi:hypothetical protein
MARGHTLKLNSYSITLKKFNEKKKNKTIVKFEDFFETYRKDGEGSVSIYTLFNRFYKEFLESFNSEFKRDKEGAKAFSPARKIEKNHSNSTIDGLFEGGLTGIEQYVQDQKRKKAKTPITKDDVAALPFYFLFWFPQDVDYGIIMIQSYGSSTINSLVKEHLKSLMKTRKFTFDEQFCISKEDKEEFFKHSVVEEISFLNNYKAKNKGNEFSALLGSSDTFQVDVRIKKINRNSAEFFKSLGNLSKAITDIVTLNVDGAQKTGSSEPKAFYKGDNSRSHAVISDHKSFIPSLILSDSLKESGKETPDLYLIRKYCMKYLKTLQEENGYTSNYILK